jgi:hypothetical protein
MKAKETYYSEGLGMDVRGSKGFEFVRGGEGVGKGGV